MQQNLKQPPIPTRNVEAAEFQYKCLQCGLIHKFFAKFVPSDKLERDLIKKGLNPIPKLKRFTCSCGFEFDLTPLINDLEMKVSKKVII